MAYATVADVQARIPTSRLTIGSSSEPSTSQVQSWLDAQSDWLDAALGTRYVTPVTAADALPTLREVCASLVASRIWTMLDGTGTLITGNAAALRREALLLLAYDPSTGQAAVTLSGAAPVSSGDTASGTFGDPTEGSVSFFGVAMEL